MMGRPVGYHRGKFPPAQLDWPRLIPLIGPANAALARYDGLLAAIPNADVLLSPMTTQEAVLSSRIEGTQATMGEVLEYEAAQAPETVDPAKRQDIEEVLNYRRAMRQATAEMGKLPLCNRLIKGMHATLLSGVRGHDKARGMFRTTQNYIGVPGRPIEEARFVPIAPEELEEGMARWERYLHKPPLTCWCN
jgi:Fic family protein